MITTYYRDSYGSTASVKHGRNTVVLTVRTCYGQIVHKKQYNTVRGARIALGRVSDSWHFVKQTGTDRIKL